MRFSPKAVLAAVVVAAAAAGVALHHAGAQDGQPDIAGNWSGKLNFRDFPMEGDEGAVRGSFEATLSLFQEGSSLSGTLSVDAEQGVTNFSLSGQVGNGNFWLSNGDMTETPVLLSGRATGSGPKMKLKMDGVFVDGADLNELTISLKKAPSGL